MLPGQRFVVPLAGTWIETDTIQQTYCLTSVVPLAGTWIETLMEQLRLQGKTVVPLAGTWIETLRCLFLPSDHLSFPLRERGLKLFSDSVSSWLDLVVPLAGTWIETQNRHSSRKRYRVVPLAGTWIETSVNSTTKRSTYVVPLAGTWIETTPVRAIIPSS